MISRSLCRLFSKSDRRSKSKASRRKRRLAVETLESRKLLTLISIVPNFPLITFNSTGALTYSAATHVLDINATPLTFQSNGSTAPTPITGSPHVEITAMVDSSGNIIAGSGTSIDFDMTGPAAIGSVPYSSPLLTGKILQFGSKVNAGTTTSQFDFRFQATGGSLYAQYFAGMDIGVSLASENSTFTGSFQANFSGGAKGIVGPTSPLPAAIFGYKFNDLNGNGTDNSEPRLSGWTITLTGTSNLGSAVSRTTTTNASGEYSFTGLAPGTYTVVEQQQAGWTQTAGGVQNFTLTSGQVAVSHAGEEGSLPPGSLEVVVPGLAFGNVKPSAIVIGMGKSPTTPQSVEVVDPNNGAVLSQFTPYGGVFQGGIDVATGDLNGSGYEDIVTAPGRSSVPQIKVFDQKGNLLTQFQAYPTSVNGGLQVAAADVFGNGLEDIITVPSWGPADVRVFKNLGVVGGTPVFSSTPTLDFLAFPSSFIGGAVVAAAGPGSRPDGAAEIIVGSGAGMKATVNVYDITSSTHFTPGVVAPPTTSFLPFSKLSPALQGGVSLAVARLTASPLADIVVGAGCNGRSSVDVWAPNSVTGIFSSLTSPSSSSYFTAFSGPSFNAPIEVTSLSNASGIANSIVAVQGPGGTTNQIVTMQILGTSPLSLSQPSVAIPGSFPGPYSIAAINHVLPSLVATPPFSITNKNSLQGPALPSWYFQMLGSP